jgi:hypothetical protein
MFRRGMSLIFILMMEAIYYSETTVSLRTGFYLSMTLAAFSVSETIHSRQDPLDGGAARFKAATCTQNKRTRTSMHRLGFEPTILVSERAKTSHVVNRAATVLH